MHRTELEHGSAISSDIIVERGYYTAEHAGDLPPTFAEYQRRPGLVVPIRDTTGEVVNWQLKGDTPRLDKDNRPVKYDTAKHGRHCLDIPLRSRPHLDDPSIPLWITEGAKKVDSGLSHGIRCIIGVLGVWGWRGTNELDGKTVLPYWEYIALKGRQVIIAYDSDVMTKASVRGALDRLSALLKQRGARLRYLIMPGLPDGSKCGLDDWFAQGNTWEDLIPLVVDHLPELSGEAQAAVLRLQTRKASTIEPRDVEWVWEPWLPAGMVGLLAGYGGGGKSTVALHIAAACSLGGTLPDGQEAPLLNTLIFAAEDSPEHTIVPRLEKMGADRERIHIVDGIAREGNDPGWVQLRNHVPAIEQAVLEHDIGLVIIDPVSSFIGDANGDKESDVRAALTPIIGMAERTGSTVLMIRHVSKAGDGTRAASRILGSTAWHDIPRVAWMLADAPDEHQPEPHDDGTRDTRRVLGVVKSNLAAKPPALCCVQPVDGPLWWLPDPSPVPVEECFISQPTRGSKGRDAEEWLQERLAGGSQPTTMVEEAATDAGISKATLKRARATLNVRAWKASTGEWMLSLPPRPASGRSEGVHSEAMTNPAQAMSAFDTDETAKAVAVNALIPFPESQAKRAVQYDDEQAVNNTEGGKALNPFPYTPDERLPPSTVEAEQEEPVVRVVGGYFGERERTNITPPIPGPLDPPGTDAIWSMDL